ncbi:ABC1 family-domain-containing protein [Globomyces pollinis-pini]|nr:ABC1 family-domain-containing protein [Globomyces pollinis-pini]
MYNYKQFQLNHSNDSTKKSNLHQLSANQLLSLFNSNGGIYIKLGQHLASLVYLLPIEYTSTFKVLQDACPPSPYNQLDNVFLKDTGYHIKDYFHTFDLDPIGVGSLAQVHSGKFNPLTIATIINPEGQIVKVAVKIQHSYLQNHAALDIKVCTLLTRLVSTVFPDFQFQWLSEEIAKNLPLELNFLNEHAHADKARLNFTGFDGLYIPTVLYSKPRILIMEFVEGCKVTDLEFLDRNRIDREQVSLMIGKIYGEMIFKHLFVHCDPHPGNIFIRPRPTMPWYDLRRLLWWKRLNFDLVLLDHGLYRTLDLGIVVDYAKFWLSIIQADEDQIERYALRLFSNGMNVTVDGISHHRLFSSMVCARSWSSITRSSGAGLGGIVTIRGQDETDHVQQQAHRPRFLESISNILAKCPPDILLLLKSNDLLRSIDQNLQVTATKSHLLRVVRQLGWYCVECVYTYSDGGFYGVLGRLYLLQFYLLFC